MKNQAQQSALGDSDFDVNIKNRFKNESESVFTKAFVSDSILIFREMKKKQKVPMAARRKLSIGVQSNQPLSSNQDASGGDPMNRTTNSISPSPMKRVGAATFMTANA